jgi:peptidoglycan/LPS O-acetylase OafA/YrhL
MAAAATSTPDVLDATPSARARARTRILLFVVLAVAAAVILFVQPQVTSRVREGDLAKEWLALGPGLLVAAFIAALLEVVRSARRRSRAWGKGFVQLGFAGLVFAFVATQSVFEYRARAAPPATSAELLEKLARSRDARVRALVMEVAGARPSSANLDALLELGAKDKDPMVRAAAARARAQRDKK